MNCPEEYLVFRQVFGTLAETPSIFRIESELSFAGDQFLHYLIAVFCPQTPDLEQLEPSLEDVESINDFEPLFSEEAPEVEKPVTTVQV